MSALHLPFKYRTRLQPSTRTTTPEHIPTGPHQADYEYCMYIVVVNVTTNSHVHYRLYSWQDCWLGVLTWHFSGYLACIVDFPLSHFCILFFNLFFVPPFFVYILNVAPLFLRFLFILNVAPFPSTPFLSCPLQTVPR